MRRFFGSIRFRMVFIYLAVIVLAFLAVSSLVSNMVQEFLVEQRTQSQTNDILVFAESLPEVFSRQEVPLALYSAAREWIREREGNNRVLYLDTDAVVQMDTASLYNGYRLAYREVRDVLVSGAPHSSGFHRINSAQAGAAALLAAPGWTVYYTVPVHSKEGALLGVLLYSTSIQGIADAVSDVTGQIGLVFLVFAVTVGLISLLLSGWLTRPILALTNAIRRVSAQGYSERVPVRGKDELAQLSEAFNIMSEKLEHHDRLRNEFVSNASHELKTPLSSMKILAEAMLYQEEVDPELSREFFEDINHEVDRLTNIINDLLRLVQEESTSQQLSISEVDYTELVQRVIRRMTPIANRKGIRLERKLSSAVHIAADAPRVEQVVSNLIDNALKYTDQGVVLITLKQEGAYALLTVQDSGMGIPKEAIPRLFERFFRVDKARSRDTGGTGLGLSIVERIVTAHGGYINVESAEGKGTTFLVYLPLRAAQEGGRA